MSVSFYRIGGNNAPFVITFDPGIADEGGTHAYGQQDIQELADGLTEVERQHLTTLERATRYNGGQELNEAATWLRRVLAVGKEPKHQLRIYPIGKEGARAFIFSLADDSLEFAIEVPKCWHLHTALKASIAALEHFDFGMPFDEAWDIAWAETGLKAKVEAAAASNQNSANG